MRSGLSRLRARTRGELRSEDGFTLVELIVAISILAITMLSLAYGMFGGMRVLQAGRHKTSFLELANAEAELVRALSYADAGVNHDDPNFAAAYPSGQYKGRPAVVLNPARAKAPPAVSVVATSGATNRPAPYTIRRWVTWTDTSGGSTSRIKRIDVTIQWTEPNGQARSVSYTTLYYPGNLGPVNLPPPTAAFTVSPTTGFSSTTSFSVNGSASSDPSGLPLTYAWDWGDGSTASGPTASKIYPSVGFRTISLVVTNSSGVASSPATQTVAVGTAPGSPAPPGNLPPTASFTATPVSGSGPLSVSMDAAASSDPNGDPLIYTWSWGDGTSNGAGVAADHVYADPGSYPLTLTVADPAGATATASRTITVTGTTCTITAASFKNPGTNATSNEIRIRSNDRPQDTQFVLSATSNSACSTMSASIPTASGNFVSTLSLLSSTATTKTWGLTTNNNDKYNTGTSQSATFTATGGPAPVNFTIAFAVRR